MNDVPPSPGESDDADDLYRRASAQEGGGPSEAVRSAILNHAAQLAAQRAAKNNVARSGVTRPTKRPMRQAWWRPAAFGTLAAAGLAGLLLIPQFIKPTAPSMSASPPAPRSEGLPADGAADAAAARASASPSASASAALSRGGAQNTENEEIVVTGARRNAVAEQAAKRVAGKPGAQDELQAQVAAYAEDKRSAASEVNEPGRAEAQSKAATLSDAQSNAGAVRSRSASGAVAAPAAATPPAADSLAGVTATAGAAAPAPRAAALMDSSAQLRRAAEAGDVAALQALLDKQPDVDARDANGRTALMLATLRGRAPAVDLLLSSGADPNAADARGTTPLQAALAGDQPGIVEALRRAGARSTTQ